MTDASRVRTTLLALVALAASVVAMAVPSQATAAPPVITLPSPEPGSFFTVFDYTQDGRVVAFDGFTVYLQRARRSQTFDLIGTLPELYRGGTDPAFVLVSPNGNRLLLGAGAGGSQYPDPDFNGNIFEMSSGGGTAELVGTFPFSIQGVFRNNREFLFGQGETFGVFTGSIELLDLDTRQARSIIGSIPGDSGGVELDADGNLYVGLGAAQDIERTGEIRRFDKRDVRRAIRRREVLDFDSDSSLVVEVLNAGDLDFDRQGDLWVGGGDFAEPDLGYVAEVNVSTGQVIRRIDPVDGNPNDGSNRFFETQFTPVGCRLGALDLNSFFNPDPSAIYQIRACMH